MKAFVLSSPVGGRVDYEKELNPEQLLVVCSGDGPSLVLAGAGSGKTRTVTYRVAHLIESGVDPAEILLLTFTNKASREMLHRVEVLLGAFPKGLWGGTFHSVGNRLLRQYGGRVGLESSFTILDEEDSQTLIKRVVKEIGVESLGTRFPSASVLKSVFSYRSNACVSLEDALERLAPSFTTLARTISDIADRYTKKKQEGQLLDFDDLLSRWNDLLEQHPDVADRLSQKFRYIFVDEFQDTNPLQGRIIKRLAQTHRNICVVGDDAQSIYGFRAATIENILRFPEWFPGTQIFRLTRNYRSTPEILALANVSIKQNTEQYQKELSAIRGSAALPSVVSAKSQQEEARYIAEQILAVNRDGVALTDIAVLFRSTFHSQMLELELTKRGIPYEFRGGLRFFDRAHIKDVLAYLRLLSNPKDEIAWLRVLSHQPGVGPQTASSMFVQIPKSSFADALDAVLELAPKAMAGWSGFLRTARPLLSHTRPSELIRALLVGEYRNYLEAEYPDAMDRAEDVEQMARFAEPMESLDAFLSEVVLRSETQVEDEEEQERDRLVLTTIHQAKGLEWEAVFVMRLQEGSFPHRKAFEDTAALEEERRLFYVAITRAKTHLFLTYPLADETSYGFAAPSTFLEELPSALWEEVRLSYAGGARRPALADPFYEEPVIVLESGDRPKKKAPFSLLREVDELL